MSTFTTKDGTPIYYNDWGSGQPVVFSHSWPLSAHTTQLVPSCNQLNSYVAIPRYLVRKPRV